MEKKNLSPLKGSYIYIWISNDGCKKNSTDVEKDVHSEVDKEQDQKDEEIKKKNNFEIKKEQGQLDESTPNIASTSNCKFSIGNELKSDDADNEINDETIDKTKTISIKKLNIEQEGKEQRGEETDTGTIIIYNDTLLHEIDNIIENYNIDVFTKQIFNDKTLIHMFVPNDIIEKVLQEVHKTQIGCRRGTSVSIVPTILNYSSYQNETPKNGKRNALHIGKEAKKEDKKQTSRAQFYKTIKSRMIVAEVIEKIEAGAEFTFDYVILVIVAAILAFLGLLEDSSVILVASMLISPIMGPILAGIFGVNIRNIRLVKIGTKREIYSLLICILVGFLTGLIIHPCVDQFKKMTIIKDEFPTDQNFSNVTDKDDREWPTDQMTSRTTSRGLIIGVFIALPSGVAAALSVLGGNMGSLVGVAISASLLPPAVNAGLFWGMSVIEKWFPSCLDEFKNLRTDCIDIIVPDCTCRDYIRHNRVKDISFFTDDNLAREFFVRGCVSLLLTLLNIVCIIIMGVICLWIKEVTPQSIPKRDSQVWEGVHYNNTIKHKRNSKEQTGLKDFFQDMEIPEESQDIFIQDAIEKLANDKDFMNIRESISPCPDKRRILRPDSLVDTYFGNLFERLNSTQQSSAL